jgi:hypothetical protein
VSFSEIMCKNNFYTYNEQAERDNKKEGRQLLIYVFPVITKGKIRIMKTVH